MVMVVEVVDVVHTAAVPHEHRGGSYRGGARGGCNPRGRNHPPSATLLPHDVAAPLRPRVLEPNLGAK